MRLGVSVRPGADFAVTGAEVVEAEKLGMELANIPEGYSFDAVSQLGYLACATSSMALASGILQTYSRTPSLTATTAAGLDFVSGGRFELGLGTSGPQVVEGFHGVPFTAPVGRTREIVEICRKVWTREPVEYRGKHYEIPLPRDRGTGLGKPLKMISRPLRQRIPISIAAIGPRNVALAAEVAEGWQPIFFHPGKAAAVWGEALAEGRSRRDPELGDLDVAISVPLAIGTDTGRFVDLVRPNLALYIGGMGARGRNFYHSLATGYGFGAEADKIQELFLSGRKKEAAQAVPEELARAVSLIGNESEVAAQLDAFEAAGVTTLAFSPLAASRSGRLEALEAVRALRPR